MSLRRCALLADGKGERVLFETFFLENLLHTVEPISQKGIEHLMLLIVCVMTGAIQNGEGSTRIVLQEVPGISVANEGILSSCEDHHWLRERLW